MSTAVDIKMMIKEIDELTKTYMGMTSGDKDTERDRIYKAIEVFVNNIKTGSSAPLLAAAKPAADTAAVTSAAKSAAKSDSPDTPIKLETKDIPTAVSGGADLPVLDGYTNLTGFEESGTNHCYLNAALQLFYHVPEFYNFIAKAENDMEGVAPIKKAFAMLEGQLKMGPNDSCLLENKQEDATEYITQAILDPFGETNALSTFLIENVLTTYVVEGNDEPTSNRVDGPKKTTGLIVEVDSSKTLAQLITETQNIQSITDQDNPTQNITQTLIPNENKYLYVVVKRFTPDTKDDTPIDSGDDIVTLVKDPIDDPQIQVHYKMRGFILHSGGIKGGHYVYYWYNNGKWMLFDDSMATILDIPPEKEMKIGYIYLYERLAESIISKLHNLDTKYMNEVRPGSKDEYYSDVRLLLYNEKDPVYIVFFQGAKEFFEKFEWKETKTGGGVTYWTVKLSTELIESIKENEPPIYSVFKDDKSGFLVISEDDLTALVSEMERIEQDKANEGSEWEKYVDDTSQQSYWFNKLTRESIWAFGEYDDNMSELSDDTFRHGGNSRRRRKSTKRRFQTLKNKKR